MISSNWESENWSNENWAQAKNPYSSQGIIVDHLGNVYVAECENNRIMCWLKESKEGRIIVGGNGEGNQANQLDCPRGISFDQEGNLYVVDEFNHRVQKFEIDMY